MHEPNSVEVHTHLTSDEIQRSLEEDVRKGLLGPVKSLPPTWFYDDEGSRLFEEITELDEYYPTRAERALLKNHAREIAQASQATTLVELGPGSCAKSRILLDAMRHNNALERYIAMDVSEEMIVTSAHELTAEYSGLKVTAVVGDFRRHLQYIPPVDRQLIAFLGGTIGNFTPLQREKFLFDLNCSMDASDYLLIGADLAKDPKLMVSAYDDASGVTARFNKNLLNVLNSRLSADFDPDLFDHVAIWTPRDSRIEMRLRSRVDQSIHFATINLTVAFVAGEELLTEISTKFNPHQLESELRESGFVLDKVFGAYEGEFLLALAHPHC